MISAIEQFISLGPWSWMILGAVLLALEILLPGTFMLWFGLAAFTTGLVVFIAPVGIQGQLIIFIIACIISVLIGRIWFRSNASPTDQPFLNQRGAQHIGKSFVLAEAIENGRGKMKIGDSLWTVTGPDASEGTMMRVVAVNGNHLTVESLEQDQS